MSRVVRRLATILALVLALGVLHAHPAKAVTRTADQERVLANLTAAFAGDAVTNADPAVASKVAAIQSAAATQYGRLQPLATAKATKTLFTNTPLGTSEANLAATYSNLATIALATVTPGATGWYGRADVQERVVDAMVWLHEAFLADQSAGYYGNWYQWEIGIPMYATRVLTLLRDPIETRAPSLTQAYVTSFDGYLRAGKNGDVDLASRFHTGANLVDITANRILQGALLGDDARIRKAVSDQLTAFATVDRANLVNGVTDGFYADGSFVQHDSVAYTGSYGKIMLSKVILTLKTLDGTGYLAGRDLSGTVQDWIARSFAPIIFEGYMMEIVKGRGVSRTTTGYADVIGVIEAATDLSRYRPAADAAALKAWVKFTTQSSRVTVNPTSFASPGTVLAWSRIMSDEAVVASNPYLGSGQSTFNSMERDVSTRGSYAFALARTSTRISPYEYMSNENLLPWFQGTGAYYLYLAGEDQTEAYGASYYALVDPTKLAGVTAPVETRKSVPALYGKAWYDNPDAGFTSSSVSQNTYVYFPKSTNTWSGGTSVGGYGISGLQVSSTVDWRDKQAGLLPADFVAYQNAEAVKSYIMLDGRIVALTAGVVDPQGRQVTTTVDSRRAPSGSTVTLTGQTRDGKATTGAVSQPMSWLLWQDTTRNSSIGYAFLDAHPVTASVEQKSANLNTVRATTPSTVVSGQVTTIGYEHPGTKADAVAYVIVPNATAASVAAVRSAVKVIENNARVQAVEDTQQRVTGVNVFAAGGAKAGRITTNAPATVLMKENDDRTVTISISDPTQLQGSIGVNVHIPWLSVVSADQGVTFEQGKTNSTIRVDTTHAYGKTFTVTLKRK